MNRYIHDKDWGDPREYDLNVLKEKNGDRTEYSVTAKPHKKLDQEIKDQFKNMTIDLDAWMNGDDPFNPTTDSLERNVIDEIVE